MYNNQLDIIENVLPEVADCMRQELEDQRKYLKMIGMRIRY